VTLDHQVNPPLSEHDQITSTLNRKFIHIDMDCFYAAVEMRDDPSLAETPLAIGGSPKKRGVVATCNYPARKFGLHSAMAMAHAVRLCPQLTILPPRMAYYQSISRQIRAIFKRYTSLIEPVSLDEAYLDVSDSTLCQGSATFIAEDIRKALKRELNLPASAGVAPNKFLAKICSDENKPNGQFVLTPDTMEAFVLTLPLGKIPGVGKVTVAKLEKLGLNTCADVREYGEAELAGHFGRFAQHLYQRACGIDNRELTTHWIRKSVSVERTFADDFIALEETDTAMTALFEELTQRLQKYNHRSIKNQVVKLKFEDFQQTTMERAGDKLDRSAIQGLLESAWDRGQGKAVRLIGLGVNFEDPEETDESQMSLFDSP